MSNQPQHSTITFKPLTEDDLVLLHQWFQLPLILQWYARSETYTLPMIREKYLPRIHHPSNIASYIIYVKEQAIGYIQLYHVSDYLPEGIENYHHALFNQYKPDELAGIDLFLADENYLGKGYGSKALITFIHQQIKGKFRAVVVDPLKHNERAIQFFACHGFMFLDKSADCLHELMILTI